MLLLAIVQLSYGLNNIWGLDCSKLFHQHEESRPIYFKHTSPFYNLSFRDVYVIWRIPQCKLTDRPIKRSVREDEAHLYFVRRRLR